MHPISFIICNYNTPDYFRFCYDSLRKNLSPAHEIILLDDGSSDDSARLWMRSLVDPNLCCIENPENVGIAYSYNTAIDAASNELVCVLHSDMYVPPGFDEAMLQGMKDHDFICSYRAEPDMYPPSKDKAVAGFGSDISSFDESGFLAWNAVNAQVNMGRTTSSMFFPWMTRRDYFTSIGGIDLLFLKYMVDDDDLYVRVKMAGGRMAQVKDAAVYHFGSRSTLCVDGEFTGQVSDAWEAQYHRSQRNFVRKWGRHSSAFWTNEMEIEHHLKYDLGIVVRGATVEQLCVLEPWASNIYIDDAEVRSLYLASEAPNTMLNLSERVRLISRGEPQNGVVLELNPAVDNVLALEKTIPEFLDRTPAPDAYALGNDMHITVRDLSRIEGQQVVNTRKFGYKKGIPEREFTER